MKIKRALLDLEDFCLMIHFENAAAAQAAFKRIIEEVSIQTKRELDDELIKLIKADRFIDAIRRYREVTGQYLKESKDYVQALKDRM